MESLDAPAKMFVSLDENEAYAGTSYLEWQLMVKQTKKFKPLRIEDIEPENGDCQICFMPLGSSDDDSPPEEPIKLLSCGHIFGHVCIINWLATFIPTGKWWDWDASDAYWPHGSEKIFGQCDEYEFHEAIMQTNVNDVSIAFQEDHQRRRDWRYYLNWTSNDLDDLMPMSEPKPPKKEYDATCPKCRGRIPILRSGVMGVKIEARLRFWDLLYEKLGISLSAKEEESRNDLLRYVQMFQVPGIEIKPEHMRSYTLQAQVSAMRFALRRGNRNLDPLQTYLRDAIFNLGCYGLHEGEYDMFSYENRRVPMWCFQIDRIERGLSPIIAPVMHWIIAFGYLENTFDGDLLEYSRAFYRELNQQVSGPWRKTLFAEVGGDRDGFRWWKASLISNHDESGSSSYDSSTFELPWTLDSDSDSAPSESPRNEQSEP